MDLETVKQLLTDKLSPHIVPRWLATAALITFFFVRVYITGSHHLLAYCLAVYMVHGFILFATPKDEHIPDPFEAGEGGDLLESSHVDTPTSTLRPFVRNLPEYHYWASATQLVIGAIFLGLFPFLDIAVYTPILVFYFIFMVCVTAVKLWNHSKRYNYHLFFQPKADLSE